MAYKIALVGSGNMASQLIHSFSLSDHDLVAVECRNTSQLDSSKLNHLGKLGSYKGEIDLRILAVSDSAIREVAEYYKDEVLSVHCSGSVNISALDSLKRPGVFYPLQTVKSSFPVSLAKVPFLLESGNKKDMAILETIAGSLSSIVQHCSSQQRSQVHVAAVFVSNFVNVLHEMAFEILAKNELGTELLEALSLRNIENIYTLGSSESLTGPAKRMDFITIQKHLELLKDNLPSLDTYTLLTNEIIRRNKE